MAHRETSLGGRAGDFPSTAWSMIVAAADAHNPSCREQLERLIRAYWRPAYGYLRACGGGVEDAKDLTQEFFTRLLEREDVRRLSPDRGSFRGFLKRALKNFLIDASRREKARRPADARLIRFEDYPDMDWDSGKGEDGDSAFEREWRRTVMGAAIEDLRGRVKPADFEAFRSYCLNEGSDVTYSDLAKKLGVSEIDVRKGLERCRRELRELVRVRIRDYVHDERDVETEYREIVRE